jgi:hypothetical protein
MRPDRSEQQAYAEILSRYLPRIANSRTREEVLAHSADALNAADGLIEPSTKRSFYEEAEYLYIVFPRNARTIENYQMLAKVLLAQAVDIQWYAGYPRYYSDQQVAGDGTLYSFRKREADFEARFIYVQYHEHILMRIPNSLRLRYRRLVNHPGRYTQGLKTTRCKKAMAGLINRISEDVATQLARARPFRVMVNSVLRTMAYQSALAQIGYVAPRNSAHLVGYAVDLEKLWYEKHDRKAHEAIKRTLANLFESGMINLIEEDTHWHVCLNPVYIPEYETLAQKWLTHDASP